MPLGLHLRGALCARARARVHARAGAGATSAALQAFRSMVVPGTASRVQAPAVVLEAGSPPAAGGRPAGSAPARHSPAAAPGRAPSRRPGRPEARARFLHWLAAHRAPKGATGRHRAPAGRAPVSRELSRRWRQRADSDGPAATLGATYRSLLLGACRRGTGTCARARPSPPPPRPTRTHPTRTHSTCCRCRRRRRASQDELHECLYVRRARLRACLRGNASAWTRARPGASGPVCARAPARLFFALWAKNASP